MPVDFKNKLFGKVLWGYSPEEVDEYIAYVAGEYTRLERRLADIRKENARTGTKPEKEPKYAAADAGRDEGNSASPASGQPRSGMTAEAEKILSEARAAADEILASAAAARDEMKAQAQNEAAGILEEARSIREQAESERQAALKLREEAEAAGREAEDQLREAESRRAGLTAVSARFREDVYAFRNAMESMMQAQLNAAERFSGDADRFLGELGAPGEEPQEAEDPFGFAAAAAVIGEMLGETDGEKEEETAPDSAPDPADLPEEPDDLPEEAEDENVEAMIAQSAVSEHISAAADALRLELEQLARSPEEAGPDEAEEPAGDAVLPGLAEPDREETAAPESDLPEEEAPAEESPAEESTAEESASSEQTVPEAGEADPTPGDEELEAVIAALSGITEDESYDAMLASFDTENSVDPAIAADLEKKRRANFLKLMREAELEWESEKKSGEKRRSDRDARQEKTPAGSGQSEKERQLEEKLSAAVEAAIRAKTDPGKALDEAFPELAETDGGSVPSLLSADLLELIDFDEPRDDGRTYTDHSLEEFASKRAEADKEDDPDGK
jgi:cell division septum initiation protein DivIVA